MNDRIKELAEQAEQYANEQNDIFGIRFKPEYDRKFAELIIRECALQCNEALVPHTGQPSMTHNYAVGLCQDKIREHFGVKE